MKPIQMFIFAAIVRPLVFVVVGLNSKFLKRLPRRGPAIVVANHNSHLDTLVLMSLFPLRMLHQVRPVAAADYFLRNRWLAWASRNIMGIIPIVRKRNDGPQSGDPLEGVATALKAGAVVILFPEGSRGDPEKMGPFKMGVAKLSEMFPEVPVCPIYLYGLGKALPKGEALLVPFFCDLVVGESRTWNPQGRVAFLEALERDIGALRDEIPRQAWE